MLINYLLGSVLISIVIIAFYFTLTFKYSLSFPLLIEFNKQIGSFVRVGLPSPSLWNESQFTCSKI